MLMGFMMWVSATISETGCYGFILFPLRRFSMPFCLFQSFIAILQNIQMHKSLLNDVVEKSKTVTDRGANKVTQEIQARFATISNMAKVF
jgi:hypothetical protein